MARSLTTFALFFLFVTLVIALGYCILSGGAADLAHDISQRPLVAQSAICFFVAALFVVVIVRRSGQLTPSAFLFLFFVAVPIFGYLGYQVFIETHGSFFGAALNFDYPVLVWATGLAAFFAGVVVTLMLASFVRLPRTGLKNTWHPRRTRLLLWFFLAISMMAAMAVVIKLGYVPFLHSGIDALRGRYEQQAGRLLSKLSRLFVIVCILASILFFISKRRRGLYLAIFWFAALFGLTLYGERQYLFRALVFFALVLFKFYRPSKRQLLAVAAIALCLLTFFVLAAENRAGRLEEGLDLRERLLLPMFSEFAYYAYVVNDFDQGEQFLGKQLFLGALVVVFPRQLWTLVGVDKDRVMERYSAVDYFGEMFRDDFGTRVTPLGEAYAGFGLFWGVCAQMFLFGLVFGWLERWYLAVDKMDVRLAVVAYLLSLLMWLPIATLVAILNPLAFFGALLLITIRIAQRRGVAKDSAEGRGGAKQPVVAI